jgi:hypothetical protein
LSSSSSSVGLVVCRRRRPSLSSVVLSNTPFPVDS